MKNLRAGAHLPRTTRQVTTSTGDGTGDGVIYPKYLPTYILNPAPCTLNPAPRTLNPAPCTLHPAP